MMRDEHQLSIGRVIARLREQQGWSQRALAKWVGLDQSAVSRIEAGRRRVSAKELQRFADALRVSADALLLGSPQDVAPASSLSSARAFPASAFDPYSEPPAVSFEREAFSETVRLSLDAEDSLERPPGREDQEPSPVVHDAMPNRQALSNERLAILAGPATPDAVMPGPAMQDSAMLDPTVSTPGGTLARLHIFPPAVAAVVRDWLELRRLAGDEEPVLTWSTGHSAEGRLARFAHPVQPAERASLGGDVLYDRVARFWRSELHVEPDDGPLPDLATLLEDGLGVQVIVARVADRQAASAEAASSASVSAYSAGDSSAAAPAAASSPTSAERPVCASFTFVAAPFIFVNAARPVILQRFALAHAFAHLVLGHGDVVDARIHWSRHNPREAAANDFAEEFLAPVRAVHRWYERRGEPRLEVETLLDLGNAFGISAWAALYRSRAAQRVNVRQFAKLNRELRNVEWELLPRQAFLGGLRDTLTHLTPGECLPRGQYGAPAVLRVPASMRAWALASVRGGRLSIERAAACLQLDARELAAQLARLGLE
jgi:transcriptional regulator with XRE-family HTH domain